MFLKPKYQKSASIEDGKLRYQLCESYRINGTVRHRVILYLGELAELPEIEQKQQLAARITELVNHRRNSNLSLFVCEDKAVEALAQGYFKEIVAKERLDISKGKDYELIDTDSVKNEDIREVGVEWLCSQALNQLQLEKVLRESGWSNTEVQLGLTHIISRASYPASEYKTSRWLKENSGACEITGYPSTGITKDKLYQISHKLYSIKDKLEEYLSKRTNELFDLEDKIIIYDLTNTYFEGKMTSSKLANYGRSKEKRSDAKLVVLALVVNKEGFIKHSQIFEGNTSDSKSLGMLIEELNVKTNYLPKGNRPTIVLDAGVATEDNIKLLQEQDYNYICVSRASIKKYEVDNTHNSVEIKDKKGSSISLQRLVLPTTAKGDQCSAKETYIRVHSVGKELKEGSMNSRFTLLFEQGLQEIRSSLSKKGGVKKAAKVWERVGRLKSKYPSVHKYYEIRVKEDNGIVSSIDWQKKISKVKEEGRYLIRTNLNEEQESTQWLIYNTIREIESTFRCLKNDLNLRPVYHKTDEATMAHLHLGMLAYWVANTIRYQLKQKGYNHDWNEIVRTMNTQKLVTTTMVNDCEQKIIIRQCSEPTNEVKHIYGLLGFKMQPFTKKKSVVPLDEIQKNKTQLYKGFSGP